MHMTKRVDITRSRWFMPAFSVFLGALILAAFWAGDNARDGVWGFLVMAALGALFLFGGSKSETLSGLGGPGRDERWAMIDLRATAFAGSVLLAALIGAWLWNWPAAATAIRTAKLMAVTGVSYIVGVIVMRRRS